MTNKFKHMTIGLALVIASFSVSSAKAFDPEAFNVEIGNGAQAISSTSVAIGNGAKSRGPSVALGVSSLANGTRSTALGAASFALGDYSVAVGGARAERFRDIAIGSGSQAQGGYSLAIGHNTKALTGGAAVIGRGVIGKYGFQDALKNDKKNSLAVGFNSDKATLFVGSSEGRGTTGSVGIGTDSPTAKLDVAGSVKALGPISSSHGVYAQQFHGHIATFNLLNTPSIISKNIYGEKLKVQAESLEVTNTANIKNAKVSSMTVDGEINANQVNTESADVGFLTGRGVMVDEVSVQKQLRAKDIEAGKAGIEALGAKEAKIENLKALDISVSKKLNAQATFTKNLFVGDNNPTNFKNTTTALVAYEETIAEEYKETDEIKDLKSQIRSKEELAERYYGYAKRYARYSWAHHYKTAGDRIAREAHSLKANLLDLLNEQNVGNKKVARVGIGVNEPKQTLHISGAMRLEPLEEAPRDASDGDMYVSTSKALCIYLDGSWNYITGPGSCDN